MKKLINYLMMGAVAATLMTTSSCTKTCDPGYEGSDCKTETRAQYYGSWKVSGTDNATPQGTYTNKDLTIGSNSGGVLKLSLSSIGLGLVFDATLGTDGKTFVIDNFTTGGYSYSGTGSFTSSSAMNLTLTEVSNATPPVTTIYTLTGTK